MTVPETGAELKRLIESKVKISEPMSKHTTWQIGGPADLFVEPSTPEDLRRLLAYANEKNLPVTILGNGSNLLVTDKGIRGVVIKIGSGLDYLKIKDTLITAGAGVKLSRLAYFAMKNELTGFEFTAGIPGTVGGALVMNAGAENSCMKDLVKKIVTTDYYGNLKSFFKENLSFDYRKSSLMALPVIVLEATFEGEKSNKKRIKKITDGYLSNRKSKQPLKYPSAGSVFKNPPGDSAGRLIEMSGGKGMKVGNAVVSSIHANFFINRGGATASDMLTLIDKVKKAVYERYGVELSLEVQVVGEQ